MFLDDWQCEFIDEALAIDRDGYPLATRVLLEIARQNGKDEILVALELGDLFLTDIPLIVNTTHRYPTTMEHYLRVSSIVKGCPDLDDLVANYYTANGNCAIALKDGRRLKFLARASGNARGFAGVRRLIFNEAMRLTKSTMGDASPTGLTKRDRQTWLTSSPPRVDSEVLHEARAQVIDGKPEAKRTLAWIYENQPGTPVRLSDGSLNIEALAEVNPAYPERITLEAFEDVLADMGEEEFSVECLGVPQLPDGGATIFGPGNWMACEDISSQIANPDKARIALDVAPNSESASFAVCGARADGLPHVELIDRGNGTGWVVNFALEYRDLWPIYVLPSPHPVAGIKADLEEAGVELVELPAGAFPQACAAIQRRVIEHDIRQIGQGPLNNAVNGAATRVSGEGWTFTRPPSSVDISPLVACTVALWAETQVEERLVFAY